MFLNPEIWGRNFGCRAPEFMSSPSVSFDSWTFRTYYLDQSIQNIELYRFDWVAGPETSGMQKRVAAAATLRGSKIFRWTEEILLYFAKIRAPEGHLCTFLHLNLTEVPA